MSLQIAQAGRIRNLDCHNACGRDKEKLQKVIEAAHHAWRVAESVERSYHQLNDTKVSLVDVILRRDELLGRIDFKSLDGAKQIADKLCEDHGEETTVEMMAADYSLFSIRERVAEALGLVAPLREHVRK
jgi:hypothetical protein